MDNPLGKASAALEILCTGVSRRDHWSSAFASAFLAVVRVAVSCALGVSGAGSDSRPRPQPVNRPVEATTTKVIVHLRIDELA